MALSSSYRRQPMNDSRLQSPNANYNVILFIAINGRQRARNFGSHENNTHV